MDAASRLRVYVPESRAEITLRSVFDEKLLPKKRNKRAVKTLIEYGTVLNDWERLTDNNCVSSLDESTLVSFQEQLQQEPLPSGEFRSPATVNKKLRTIKPLIKLCWPKDSHNPSGLGHCDYFEFPERLPEDDPVPYIFSYDELSRMYAACNQLRWPRRHAALTWRTILVTHFCCGPRTYDLLSLKWSDVDFWYRKTGAIRFRARKTRKLQRIPLHRVARAHLKALHEFSGAGEDVFPSFTYSNQSTIRRHWRRLKEHSGVPVGVVQEDLRKTCNTAYNDRWPGVGDFVLGHRLSGVNAKHYYDPTRIVFQAVRRLPVPDAFHSLD